MNTCLWGCLWSRVCFRFLAIGQAPCLFPELLWSINLGSHYAGGEFGTSLHTNLSGRWDLGQKTETTYYRLQETKRVKTWMMWGSWREWGSVGWRLEAWRNSSMKPPKESTVGDSEVLQEISTIATLLKRNGWTKWSQGLSSFEVCWVFNKVQRCPRIISSKENV